MNEPEHNSTLLGRHALLRPRLCCRDLSCLDFACLAERGIFYYCLDLDNTLAPRADNHPLPHIAAAFNAARRQGYVRDACIVSNIIFGNKRRQRVAQFAQDLEIEHFFAANFFERKPCANPFRFALQAMGAQAEQTAMVGDQLFTDIVGGNALGLYTILVEPLGPDHWSTRLTGRRRREEQTLRALGLRD